MPKSMSSAIARAEKHEQIDEQDAKKHEQCDEQDATKIMSK